MSGYYAPDESATTEQSLEYACIALRAVAIVAALPFVGLVLYFMVAVSRVARDRERAGGLLTWLFPIETAFFSRQSAVRARARQLLLLLLWALGIWVIIGGAFLLMSSVCRV